jgi:3',5'-cyclic-AMP phosphodiesterase
MRGARALMTVLAALLLAGASAGLAQDVPLDEDLVALFADLHSTGDTNNPHQRAGIAQCVRDVLALNPRPANVLFYGDLAFDHGDTNDYRLLRELVGPLEGAGIRWHAALGNHDRREAFLSVFPERREPASPVPGRLVAVVETPRADFILLDSCLEGPVDGGIDEAQCAWLRETLGRHKKPVFVGAHHPIKETGVASLMASNDLCAALHLRAQPRVAPAAGGWRGDALPCVHRPLGRHWVCAGETGRLRSGVHAAPARLLHAASGRQARGRQARVAAARSEE